MQKAEQVTVFDLLEGFRTPLMPPEQMKPGVKAWVIEAAGITNSMDWDAPILFWKVRPRRVQFKRVPRFSEKWQKWETGADSCDHKNFFGWSGYVRDPTFTRRPCFADQVKYVEQQRDYTPGTPIQPWE
jgi:hypothetical protein